MTKEYDYEVQDIEHIEMHVALRHDPARADVKYTVFLKDGREVVEAESTLTGIPAANVAISVLENKNLVDAVLAAGKVKDDPHAWVTRRRG